MVNGDTVHVWESPAEAQHSLLQDISLLRAGQKYRFHNLGSEYLNLMLLLGIIRQLTGVSV